MRQRFAIDTHVFDRIVDSDETLELVRGLVAAGKIEIVSTHVQHDELAAIPDPVKRGRIRHIPTRVVPTYGFVVEVSRLDMARLAPAEPYYAITSENPRKHARDALIAMTAKHEGATLVTDDDRLQKRATAKLSLDTWPSKRFLDHLRLVDAVL